MRTLLGVLVIAAVATLGAYVYGRPTVARGHVFADMFLSESPLLSRVECDDEIPIKVEGAQFVCDFYAKDGDHARVEVTMDRAGSYHAKALSESHPEHKHVPPSGDPWE